MSAEIISERQYKTWLTELKNKVRNTQIKAAVTVNVELLYLYWELGADIVLKQSETKWGDRFLSQLSKDLTSEFPEMKGFSERNLKYIRQWFSFYTSVPSVVIGQQPVAQLEFLLLNRKGSIAGYISGFEGRTPASAETRPSNRG